MRSKTYKHTCSDGAVITVDGSDIFDYVDARVAAVRAYAKVLANQDPASSQFVLNALILNLDMIDEVCHLLQFMADHVHERERLRAPQKEEAINAP